MAIVSNSGIMSKFPRTINSFNGYYNPNSRDREKHLQLLTANDVTLDYKEIGIQRGYRPESCTVQQCVQSAFESHNETANIWTHGLAGLYFFYLFLQSYPGSETNAIYYVPFRIYQTAAFSYTFISAIAHTFSCCSVRVRHIAYFLDYSASSMFGFCVGFLYYSYSMPLGFEDTIQGRYFLSVAAFNSILATLSACASRICTANNLVICKVLRLVGFIISYAWVTVPLISQLTSCSETWCNISNTNHYQQIFWMIVSGVIYGSHLPEKVKPGCFDFIGHSHNIFHVSAALATKQQMNAALLDILNRKLTLQQHVSEIVHNEVNVGSNLFFMLMANIIIVSIFSAIILKKHNGCNKKVD